jgi:carboxylesterase
MGVISGRLIGELHEVTEIAQEALPEIDTPILYIASRQDNRVPAFDALRNWTRITSPVRRFVWLDESGHVITVDYEKHTVFHEVVSWLNRFKAPV